MPSQKVQFEAGGGPARSDLAERLDLPAWKAAASSLQRLATELVSEASVLETGCIAAFLMDKRTPHPWTAAQLGELFIGRESGRDALNVRVRVYRARAACQRDGSDIYSRGRALFASLAHEAFGSLSKPEREVLSDYRGVAPSGDEGNGP